MWMPPLSGPITQVTEYLALQTQSDRVGYVAGEYGLAVGHLSTTDGSSFTLNSAWLIEPWPDEQNVRLRVQGFENGSQQAVYDYTYQLLTTTTPIFATFPASSVDYITFTSTSDNNSRAHFAIDNITINAVPEPSTFWVGLCLALPLLSRCFRKTDN